MTTVNLYPDTNCNSGTCGRVIPWVGGLRHQSIVTRIRVGIWENPPYSTDRFAIFATVM